MATPASIHAYTLKQAQLLANVGPVVYDANGAPLDLSNVTQLGDAASGTYQLHTSLDELGQLLAGCSPATLGSARWIPRMQCWTHVLPQYLAELEGALPFLTAFVQAQVTQLQTRNQVAPEKLIKNYGQAAAQIADFANRKGQPPADPLLDLVATARAMAVVVTAEVAMIQRDIDALNVRLGDLGKQEDAVTSGLASDPATWQQVADELDAFAKSMAAQIVLPLVDLIYWKVKIVRQISQLVQQNMVTTGQELQTVWNDWNETLAEWAGALDGLSHIFDGGLLGMLDRFLGVSGLAKKLLIGAGIVGGVILGGVVLTSLIRIERAKWAATHAMQGNLPAGDPEPSYDDDGDDDGDDDAGEGYEDDATGDEAYDA